MTVTIETLSYNSAFGVSVSLPFFRHDPPSDRLMVLLPGRGYTIDHPLLFHLRYVALENGWDALPVQYGFQVTGGDFGPEQLPLVQQDVALAVRPVLERGYRHLCVAGKSLGTPLAVDLAQSAGVEAVSQVLLTPIGGVMQAVGDVRTLAVVGTHDALYSPDIVRLTESSPHITWRVFDDLDHALINRNNWRMSLQALHDIMLACELFLRQGM